MKCLSSKFDKGGVEKFSKMLGEKYPNILISAFTEKPRWEELFGPPLKEWGVKLPETREEVEEIIKKVEKKK